MVKMFVTLWMLLCVTCVNSAAVTETFTVNITDVPPTMSIKEVEKSVEDMVNSLTKMVLPYVVQNSDLKMTPSCMSTIIKMFGHAKKLKVPGIQLLDAMAKPPYGMLRGTFAAMGDYDECLAVSANKKGDAATSGKDEQYHGRYCTVEMQLPHSFREGVLEYSLGKKNISDLGKLGKFIEGLAGANFAEYFQIDAGLCIPSTCTIKDLQEVIKIIPVTFLPMKVKRCEDNRNKFLSTDQAVIVSLFGIVIILVVLATFYEGLTYAGIVPKNPRNSKNGSKWVECLLAFSMYGNTKKLMTYPKDSSSEISCINGMYVMGTLLVVIYHTYFLPFFTFFTRSVANFGEFMKAPEFTLVPTMAISIEAYFLFSGLFLVYGRFKRGGEIRVNILKILVRRYLRMCPSMLIILGIILILPIVGSGPVWGDIFQVATDNTKTFWWTYVIMVNNFLAIKDLNFLYLWFIPCLLQITILGTILLWILSKHRKLGIFLIVATAVGCNVTLGIITAIKNYPPTYAIYFYHNREKFEHAIYTSPLSHVTSFNIGMLLGYYMSQRSKVTWSRLKIVLGWPLCFAMTVGIQMIMYIYHDGKDANPIVSGIYAATHKTLFSIGIAWVILACTYGYGGVMSKILSWKVFGPLSKLGYMAYLIHYIVIAYHVSCTRTTLDFTHLDIWYRIWGYIALTFFFAYLLYIMFELPLKYLEAMIFPRPGHAGSKTLETANKVKDEDVVRFTLAEGDCRKSQFQNNLNVVPQYFIQHNEHSKL